jgi:hypothetical protein
MKSLKINILIIIFFYSSQLLNSQTLSNNSEISLITCNPGTELYSVFGHSAIRVYDPVNGVDWVYNYGTFNFNEPGFYMKFIRGYLNYQLTVYRMSDMLAEYNSENRSLYEQVLNLTQAEKQSIFEFLEFNRLPENKYYLYDFFFDNCATRIRDVFQKELKEKLDFTNVNYNNITFRQILKPYLAPHPWSRVGINLILGTIADRPATINESMFIPDYMKMAFEQASIKGQSKNKFVKAQSTLFVQKNIEENNPFYARPFFVLSVIFLLVFAFTFLEFRNQSYYKLIDFIVFLAFGLIGFLLFFLWFLTDHTAVVKNWNLLWAMPTHLIFAFLVFKKTKSAVLKYYFLVNGLLAFAVLPLWTILPQRFDIAFVPLILIVSLRSYQMFRFHR